MMKKQFREGLVLLLLIFIGSPFLFAWPVINGIAICTATNIQASPKLVSDGSGGAIIDFAAISGGGSAVAGAFEAGAFEAETFEVEAFEVLAMAETVAGA